MGNGIKTHRICGGALPSVSEIVTFTYDAKNGSTFEFKTEPDAFVIIRQYDLTTSDGWIDMMNNLSSTTSKVNAKYIYYGGHCSNLSAVAIGGTAVAPDYDNYRGTITRTGAKSFSVGTMSINNSNGIPFSVIALQN